MRFGHAGEAEIRLFSSGLLLIGRAGPGTGRGGVGGAPHATDESRGVGGDIGAVYVDSREE